MTVTTGRRGRGPRTSPAVQEQLAQLKAARDRLDAEQAERRRREDAAFAAYAAAAEEVAQVLTGEQAALADLERKRAAIVADARARRADLEQRQGAILAELNGLGRSAEDLAALFGLPVKRVRAILRNHRHPDAAEPATVSTPAIPSTEGGDQPELVHPPAAEPAAVG